MQKIIDWLKEHKIVVLAVLIVAVISIAYAVCRRSAVKQAEQQKPAVVTQEQTRDAKALQRQLDISRANAEALRQQLATVQAEQRAPAATYYVTAPTVERARRMPRSATSRGASRRSCISTAHRCTAAA